jgi:hypothetical protein
MQKISTLSLIRRSVAMASTVLLAAGGVRLLAEVTPATSPTAMPATMPVAAPATAGIDQLINQLGSDSSDERDLAQKKLVDAGRAALPALTKAAESSTDPEIRSRAAAALAQLKEHDDNDVSLITVHMKNAPAQDVLNAISSQAHAQITSFATGRVAGADTRDITIDADNKPFWDVMSDVCGQLNVCPMTVDTPGKAQLRLMSANRNWMLAPHEVVGPFWIGAASVFRARTIDLMGTPNIDDQFTVRLLIFPEPKLAVAQISDLTLKEATDDAGHSLIPTGQAHRPMAMGLGLALTNARLMGGQANHTIETRLSYPDHPGTKIAVLRGEVQVQLGQDVQQYIIDDVMGTPKVTNPLKNCTVKITCTKPSERADTYLVTLAATREGLSDDQWAALTSRMNQVTLEDADGHELNPLNHIMGMGSSDSSFKTTLYFSSSTNALGVVAAGIINGGIGVAGNAVAGKTGAPKKLTWNVATTLKTVKVPVELKDLPMP